MVEFDWDQNNRAHIEDRHGVYMHEAEEVVMGKPRVYTVGYRSGEHRVTFVGPTAAERMLHVVTTTRGDRIRVITAYPARPEMVRFYREREKEE